MEQQTSMTNILPGIKEEHQYLVTHATTLLSGFDIEYILLGVTDYGTPLRVYINIIDIPKQRDKIKAFLLSQGKDYSWLNLDSNYITYSHEGGKHQLSWIMDVRFDYDSAHALAGVSIYMEKHKEGDASELEFSDIFPTHANPISWNIAGVEENHDIIYFIADPAVQTYIEGTLEVKTAMGTILSLFDKPLYNFSHNANSGRFKFYYLNLDYVDNIIEKAWMASVEKIGTVLRYMYYVRYMPARALF